MDNKVYFSEETQDVLDFLFSCNGRFTHYSYFSKQLWRKVKGRENEDQGEVHAMFMHLWLHQKYGTYSTPCGCAWYNFMDDREYPYNNGVAEKQFNDYIEKWKDIISDFNAWCAKQR